MLALEVAFLAALAILHLSNSDIELRALARAGQGGGLVGWGLSYPFYLIIGRQASLILFIAIAALAGVVCLGLKRRHIVGLLERLAHSLQAYSSQETQPRPRLTEKDTLQLYARLASAGSYRSKIMHIRTDPDQLPEPVKVSRQAPKKTKAKPVQVPGDSGAAASSDARDSDDSSLSVDVDGVQPSVSDKNEETPVMAAENGASAVQSNARGAKVGA